MFQLKYFCCVLLCSGVISVSVLKEEVIPGNGELNRSIRSPSLFKKKPLLEALFGGGLHGGGAHGGGGETHITNINNYGPHGQSNYGHGQGGGSFAGSGAFAGGHGTSQAQSQSASFALGPYAASFSQSQAQSGGGGRGRSFDYYDY